MKTVLVVDDNEDIRELSCHVLRQAGYRVLEAQNGEEALRTLEAMRDEPCLVLLDLMMPVLDGHGFLERLADHHHVAALPVVIVSASVTGPVAGARKVVRKPVSPELLRLVVKEFCGEGEPVHTVGAKGTKSAA